MYADELRRAAMAAPRTKLPEVSAALWQAYAAGVVSEEDAGTLLALIEARKVTASKQIDTSPAAGMSATMRRMSRVGSRPRSSASLERRRRWVSSGYLPPQLACRFTLGEAAALAVVASEVSRHGRCTLALGHLAALAGVCKSTVRAALHQARKLGLVSVQARPVKAFRSDTNVVTITSAEWRTWLAVGRKGGGYKSLSPTQHSSNSKGRHLLTVPGQPMGEAIRTGTSSQRGAPWGSGARWRAFGKRGDRSAA